MDKPMILVVDDTPDNINLISGMLRRDYRVKAATCGERALAIAAASPMPDLILLDIMMPKMDGYEVCRRLKQNPLTSMIPVIFVTALNEANDERRGFELGAVDYITKPISAPVLEARVQNHLVLHNQQRELERQVQQRTRQLHQSRLQIIRRLGRAAEFKDNETGMHVIRMSHYARLIAEASGANSHWVTLLFNAAPMHDIGKIGIPDTILTKNSAFNEEERAIMQRHPEIGAEIIGDCEGSELLALSREVALTHHEWWDGHGYPAGLSGEDIPLSGRIVAVADVFDALTSLRPYKGAWSEERAISYIRDHGGTQFDPEIVGYFDDVLPQILEIKHSYSDSLESIG
ncbi:response regulator [Ectothiorhodospiraceae bacterium BW-2]|nr:response regulator [Ectothiorhodospiraceae bacterium BW-2]